MAVSAAALWLNTTFAGFDAGVATAIHGLYDMAGGFFNFFMPFVSFFSKPVMIILIGLLLACCKKTRPFGLAFLISITVGALITNCCLKLLIPRPRPYTDEASIYHQFWMLTGQHMESDNSFPSGHATGVFAAMTAIYLRCDRRWSWLAYVYAVLVAVSRIYMCVHYTTDVVVGIVVGLTAGFIGTYIAVKLPPVVYEFDFFRMKKGKHMKPEG